jgi:hypothetical protein
MFTHLFTHVVPIDAPIKSGIATHAHLKRLPGATVTAA